MNVNGNTQEQDETTIRYVDRQQSNIEEREKVVTNHRSDLNLQMRGKLKIYLKNIYDATGPK